MTLLADAPLFQSFPSRASAPSDDPSAGLSTRLAEFGVQSVALGGVAIPRELSSLVPRALAERHTLIPFAREGRRLQVAVVNPADFDGVDTLNHFLDGRMDVETWIAPRADIESAIERVYDFPAETDEFANSPETPASDQAHDRAAVNENDAPVIKLAQDLVAEASRRRASDIHVEPLEQRVRVRYRIDGFLVQMPDLPKALQLPLISRLKLMANISIAEKRLPQDGRIQFNVEGRSLDLRVSTLPTVYGESIVMRLLDRADLRPGLSELGLLAGDRARFEQVIASPHGLVLVTGPTGSGKTTTLYSCLHHLNQPDRKIVTVEDPVEYQLNGINQVPVRHETGMTFGSALRAMLRQAPNIIMVGEIRDRETAEIAINASLTGHVVFSTLHTNDATGAVARLLDMGVKPFLLSASLRAVLAQRLVRKVCDRCRQPYRASEDQLAALGTPGEAAPVTLMRGTGCPECNGTGFRGRVGLFELLVMTGEFELMVQEGASPGELRQRARALGMRTLREDGARKVIAGLTTIEEVVSITAGDTS